MSTALVAAADPQIETRIAGRQERVHILTGAVCNNNCIFCMEEDRDERYRTNSQTSDEVVRWILDSSVGSEEICFTSGEPTTNPALAKWVFWAKQKGYPKISMMTNGRALSHEPFARKLMSAGMNRMYVSIHGHTEKLHEGLTRTPGSFAQTVAGLEVIRRYKSHGIEVHTSTVITKRNLPHMAEVYTFLRERGVDQVVFNVMQANGRADTYFEQIFPSYTQIAATAKTFFDARRQVEDPVMAFLVDIPLCTTTALPDFNRGYVERYVHFEPPSGVHEELLAGELADRETGPDGTLVQIRRGDLDKMARQKRAECSSCRYDDSCEGVWNNYVRRAGWSEFVPVPR